MQFWDYAFMWRALAAGLAVGVAAPLIGTFLVAKRLSLIADTLAHVSLIGVAIGLLLGIYPFAATLLVCMIAGLAIERLRTNGKISGEAVLGMFLPAGLAIALLIISLANGLNANILSYLFGSITTATNTDVFMIYGLTAITVLMVALNYKQLFNTVFDEEAARVSGVRVNQVNLGMMAITAMVVAITVQVVGALLAGALMVIPVVTAGKISQSFKQTIYWSMAIAIASVAIGLITAFYLNLPAGATIVITALAIFGISSFSQR